MQINTFWLTMMSLAGGRMMVDTIIWATKTLIMAEGAIMSPVLPTYIADIIHDVFLMSARHSRILGRHFISKVTAFVLHFG